MKKTKFGKEQTWTDADTGEAYPVKFPTKEIEFDAFPENFIGSDRECGKTCGVANAAQENIKLFPGKGRFVEITRSRAHLITVINRRRYMIPYQLTESVRQAIAKWDRTRKMPDKPIHVKLQVPTPHTGKVSGEPTGNGYSRRKSVRRGFYLDERTGKRMKYTIINGDPIKHEGV